MKKIAPLRHITIDISLFTTNPTWSGPRCDLYKRDWSYSRTFINPSSWRKMWTY